MKTFKQVKQVGTALALSTALLLSQVGMVSAQLEEEPTFSRPNTEDAGFKIEDLGALIQGLLGAVMFVAALLVFAYMIWGGIQWITSGGDKGKTEEARNKITAAIIGLAVLAAAYAVFALVTYFLGVDNPFTGGENVPIKSIQQIQDGE